MLLTNVRNSRGITHGTLVWTPLCSRRHGVAFITQASWDATRKAEAQSAESLKPDCRAHGHRTLPPNIPGDIQGILAIYPKYTGNIPGGEYTPNIPQSIQTGDDSSTSMVT